MTQEISSGMIGTALFQLTSEAVIVIRPTDWTILTVNPAFEKLSGYSAAQVVHQPLEQFVETDITPPWMSAKAFHSTWSDRIRLKTVRGKRLPSYLTLSMLEVGSESLVLAQLRSETVREWNERRQTRHREVLELVALGKPLTSILEAIVAFVEAEAPDTRCSILLVDDTGTRLMHGAALKLPADFIKSVDGLLIGPNIGSCGTAASTKKRFVVSDVMTHPNWVNYREVASRAGIRACWSDPIMGVNGEVLGTFANYSNEPYEPTERELEAVNHSIHLASIAIEQHRSVQALQASQRMLRIVLDSIPQGVFWKDTASRYLGCNQVVAQAFGLTSPDAIIGLNDSALTCLTPEQAEFFIAKDREVIESNRAQFGIVEPATLKNGQTIWMETNKIPLVTESGQVTGVLGTWQDITERKAAEDKLRASEERLSAIASTMPQSLYVFDLVNQQTIYTNRELWRDLGYAQTDLQEMGPDFMKHLLHPDDLAQVPRLLQRWETANDGDVLEVEYRMKHRNGEWRWFLGRDAVYQRDQHGRVIQFIGTTKDITEEKNAQDEIRKSEQKYRVLVETSHDLIWSVDRDGRWTYVNRHGAKITYGYEPEEMLGRPFREFVAAEQAQKDFAVFARILQGEPIYHYETEHIRKDGTPVILRYNAVPIFDDQQQIIGTTGTATDITNLVQTSAQLRRSEQRLQAILDAEPECVKLLNQRGELLDMNPVGLAMIGAASLEQVRGHCVYDLVIPEHRASFEALIKRIAQGESGRLEFQMTTLSGQRRWMDMNAAPIPFGDDKNYSILSVTRDITQRKQTENELHEKKALLEGVSKLQREFLVGEVANRSFDLMLNYLLKTTLSEYGFIGEILQQQDGKRYLKAYAINNIAWNTETHAFYQENAPAGLEFHNLQTLFGAVITNGKTLISNDPSRDPRRGGLPQGHPDLHAFMGLPLYHGEELIGMVGLANRLDGYHDGLTTHLEPIISTCASLVFAFRLERERSDAERERRALEAKIQQTQKLESLGILAGGIAHDFNNLLTSILGYSDLALLELPPDSSTFLLIEEAVNGARRAAELTKQMLAYSGKGRFVVEPISLSQLAEDMARLLHVSVSKRAILQYNLQRDLPAIEADAVQIRQIIMNLIINASEAIGDVPGTIVLTTGVMQCDREYLAETYLDEQLPEGVYAYFDVTDTGSGMSAETCAKIFDPFFTTKFTGRGLGLSAVLGIVRGHKGAIKCYSELGRGTTFRVLFPTTDQPAKPITTREPPPPTWRSTGIVLVVDDEPSVLALARRMLERIGFTVWTASDGLEAVSIFNEHAESIRLVLLDMTMPNMDGEETFIRLRERRPNVKAILSSGYNEQTATNRFAGQGLAGFVQKPYTFDQLLSALKKVIEEVTSSS